MKNILKKRILDLGRGEDGVALVVTLAVFMFMYIFCAGVFAVGKMVKDRICLQNAADAAAYSAAVVQADTLSRIATINRAMSWTYAQMNKRRMDFLEWHWLDLTRRDYQSDVEKAKQWVMRSQGKWHTAARHTHGTMRIGEMVINGRSSWPTHVISNGGAWPNYEFVRSDNAVPSVSMTPVRRRLNDELSGYESYFNGEIGKSVYNNGGLYGIDGLQMQIDADIRAILAMNDAESQLINSMPGHIDVAAREILRANVEDFDQCGYVVRQCRRPGHPDEGFLRPLESDAFNELRFLEWGNSTVGPAGTKDFTYSNADFESGLYESIVSEYFRSGSELSRWFPRVSDGGVGFLRQYRHPQSGPVLNAKWDWRASYCPQCTWWYDRFNVRHEAEGVQISSGSSSVCTIEDTRIRSKYGRYYLGMDSSGALVRARPVEVRENFFSGAGTITVGIARPNANPWRSVLGKTLANIGLYHAFDPFLDWMVCFASARAGYKILHMPSKYESEPQEYKRWESSSRRIRIEQKPRIFKGERDYCIDWKELQPVIRKLVKVKNKKGVVVHGQDWHWEPEWVKPLWRQSWNLRQSDWDAVMIPVCRAASGARERTDYQRTYGDFREPCWGATDPYYLTKIVRNDENDWRGALGATTDAYQAGRLRPQAVQDLGYVDYAPGDLHGLVDALPNQYHGWNANAVQRGGTTAIKWPFQWRVSGFGRSLNWVELQRHMLH